MVLNAATAYGNAQTPEGSPAKLLGLSIRFRKHTMSIVTWLLAGGLAGHHLTQTVSR